MAPPAALRWCAVVSVLILSLLASPSFGIYCDEDDCYDLLGVSQNANASEILHALLEIILKDEATWEQYDHAIAHPEEVLYNTARYYHAYYVYKMDHRAVLVGLLLVLSAFQYPNSWTRYNQAVAMVKKTPAYKNRPQALELERSGGTTNKKKSNRQMDKKIKEDLSKELELDIKGAEKPCIWKLIGVRFALLPYTLGKLLFWHGHWFWRYKVKQASYAWGYASYLMRKSLGVPLDAWMNIGDSTKKDLVQRQYKR
ncbi:hypothetical protein SLA2020_186550 [Shorea laevis]